MPCIQLLLISMNDILYHVNCKEARKEVHIYETTISVETNIVDLKDLT